MDLYKPLVRKRYALVFVAALVSSTGLPALSCPDLQPASWIKVSGVWGVVVPATREQSPQSADNEEPANSNPLRTMVDAAYFLNMDSASRD